MDNRANVVLRVDGEVVRAPIVKGSGNVLLVQGRAPCTGETTEFAIEASWLPKKAVRGCGRAAHVGAPDSGIFALRAARLASGAGAAPIKDFLRTICGVDLADMPQARLDRVGHYWWFQAETDGAVERMTRLRPEELEEILSRIAGDGSDSLYLRQPLIYLVNSTPFSGRAVRITPSSLVVHTNSPLPPLGSLVHLQFTVDCGLVERYAVVRGGIARRSDDRQVGSWKGRFDVKIYDVEDLERRGVFERMLERSQGAHLAARHRAEDAPPLMALAD